MYERIIKFNIEQKMDELREFQPDGAVSDVTSQTSYYWFFDEAIPGNSRSFIHVAKVKNGNVSSESAQLLINNGDILKCLNFETERQIRRCERSDII